MNTCAYTQDSVYLWNAKLFLCYAFWKLDLIQYWLSKDPGDSAISWPNAPWPNLCVSEHVAKQSCFEQMQARHCFSQSLCSFHEVSLVLQYCRTANVSTTFSAQMPNESFFPNSRRGPVIQACQLGSICISGWSTFMSDWLAAMTYGWANSGQIRLLKNYHPGAALAISWCMHWYVHGH